MRFVVDGFVYHSNLISGTPPLRYLGCAELKKSGCRGRATLPVGGHSGQLRIMQQHNHPPDAYAEEKDLFVKGLKSSVRQMECVTLKRVYETMADMYLGCSQMKKNGCKARAILPVGATSDKLRVTKPHNHPPDQDAHEKDMFVKNLKKAAQIIPGSLKKVYDEVALLYPIAANEVTFKSVCSSMHRWRKSAQHGYTISYGENIGETRRSFPKLRKYHRIVHNGFLYNISTTRHGNRRYYRCANKRNSGCFATAFIETNGCLEDLSILRPHNHPPDRMMEMKYNFEMELTKAVKNSNISIKAIYDSLAEIHPDAAKLLPFDTNLSNKLKRRRSSPHEMYPYS